MARLKDLNKHVNPQLLDDEFQPYFNATQSFRELLEQKGQAPATKMLAIKSVQDEISAELESYYAERLDGPGVDSKVRM